MRGLGLGLGLSRPGGRLPPLPSGFAFLVTEDNEYIVDERGDYIIAEVA